MDFYQETKKYLKQTSDATWELASPHVLYLSKQQAAAYTGNKGDRQYRKFHDDTVGIMQEHAPEIVASIDGDLTLVDLGPEYPDKTLPIMHAARASGKKLSYIPVDINADYVKLAGEVAKPFVDRVIGLQSMFEECAGKIPVELRDHPLVFLGLTFMNYQPDFILETLKKIAGASGKIAVAAELLGPNNTVEYVEQHYKNDQVKEFALGPARHLGLNPDDLDFDIRFHKKRIEVGFLLKKDSSPDLSMKAGDRLIAAISYRYTKEELERLLEQSVGPTTLWTSKQGKAAVAIAQCS